MKITEEALRAIMPKLSPEKATSFAAPLNLALEEFDITSSARVSMFLGQIAHESAQLTRWEENLNYSAEGLMKTWPKRFNATLAARYARNPQKIANAVYANRMGNGDEQSGDGWRYRGRGCLMLTGRANYRSAGAALTLPLEQEPERVAQPEAGFRVAGWFWKKHDLNTLADDGEAELVTKRINGGIIGLVDRLAYIHKAQEVLA